MPTTTTTSTQFAVNLKDILKGLLVAVLTPVFTIVITSLQAGSLVFNWTAIGITALIAGMSYILKNFLTPAQIIVEAPPATVEAVKEGEAEVKVINKP